MFKTAIATVMMMLAPAGAQYLGNHSANPYAPHAAASPYAPDSVTNPYSRPLASPYAAPKLYGSPGADKRQMPLNPYDPDALNNNRFVYSPDGTRNPYGAGNPYSPTTSTNPYKLRAPGND